ncbi:MAG: hypothetical protein ACYTAF_01105 [Planctomycetota bacterium]|jgi:hypothetical protein
MKRAAFISALVLLAACSNGRDGPVKPEPVGQADGPAKVKVVSKGKAFAPGDYLVPGYVTILDLYADW